MTSNGAKKPQKLHTLLLVQFKPEKNSRQWSDYDNVPSALDGRSTLSAGSWIGVFQRLLVFRVLLVLRRRVRVVRGGLEAIKAG
jgi:hypothetical protein